MIATNNKDGIQLSLKTSSKTLIIATLLNRIQTNYATETVEIPLYVWSYVK